MDEKTDSKRLLSNVGNDTIMVICEDCEILEKLNCYQLLAELGDLPLPSALEPIAKSLKCPRVENKYYNRCALKYHYHPDEWARLMGYVKPGADAPKEQSLGDLSEWHRLVAGCRACGHRGEVDRWALQRRYGRDMKLSAIAARLSCKECPVKDQGYVVVTSAKR